MPLRDRLRSISVTSVKFSEWLVLALLVSSVLWRGGKSLDMTWMLTGVAVCVSFIWHCDYRNRSREISALLWVAVIAFSMLSFAAFFTSTTKNYGLDEVMRTASFGLLFLWVIRHVKHPEHGGKFLSQFLRVFSVTVLMACGVGILVYTLQPVNRFVGTFFDFRFHTDYWPNAWADFLLLAWPIVLYSVFSGFRLDRESLRSRCEFLLRAAVFGMVIGCLLLSYSRGALLAFLFQLAVWALVLYRALHPQFPVRKVLPPALIVGSIALLFFLGLNALRGAAFDVQDVSEKVTFTASEGGSSVTERVQFWTQALQLSAQKPLVGWGPYSFRFVQPELQSDVLATSDHAHNVVLKILMERGIAATVLFLLLLGTLLFFAIKMLVVRGFEGDVPIFSLHVFLVLGLVGTLFHNLIDFNMQFVGISLPFWLLLGILITFLDVSTLRTVPASIARFVEVSIAVLLLVTLLYEGTFLAVSSLGRRAEAAGNPHVALLWYESASRWEFFTRDLELSRAKLLEEQGRLTEAMSAVDAYLVRNAEDFRAWKRQGELSLALGEEEGAIVAYERAFVRGKWNDLGVLRGLLQSYMAFGREGEITRQRPMIDALLQSFSEAIRVNAHFIALSPNVEEMIVICTLLAKLYPSDAPRYQVMAARADHQAEIERGKVRARVPGFLW